MRKVFLFCAVLFVTARLLAQKPAIDTAILGRWPSVSGVKLSADGKYVTFSIRETQGVSQVVASTRPGWKKAFPGAADADILSNNNEAILRTTDDSLYLLQLGTNRQRYIGQVAFYYLLRVKDHHEWLAYQEAGGEKRFFLRETATGKLQSECRVQNYLFNEAGSILLLQVQKSGSSGEQLLYRWDLATGEKKIIWKGGRCSNWIFDEEGRQIAFMTDERFGNAIWYYREGMGQAEKYVCDTTIGIDINLKITVAPFDHNGPLVFSMDGKNLFFQLEERPARQAKPSTVKVDVWNYKDVDLQEYQLLNLSTRRYAAVLQTKDRLVRRLQMENETLNFYVDLRDCNRYIIVTRNSGHFDLWWQPEARASVYLESVRDGSRVLLKDHVPYNQEWGKSMEFTLSPNEKYVVYYDPVKNNYFTYEIASKITRNITKGIDARWRDHSNEWVASQLGSPIGIAGWLENDAAIVIYDAYDIWEIDPSGEKKPLNVTGGYGLAHHTLLRLTGDPNKRKVLVPDACILLAAFDTANKYRGFYHTSLSQTRDPLLLTMGPYVYGDPVKAENADIWIMLRQSDREAPNYFLTKDWKDFTTMSNIQPQRAYNWLTSELVKWVLPDGSIAQGILYKPEDFDPCKKYPLLIQYYEEHSSELYKFKEPDVTRDEINIPYFVSRGYLVLIPDITYNLGLPGESVVNTVLSGVRYLCQNPWVDSTRMGLQGHSFGGWETNYLVTHTHIFAAAAEGAGNSNLISAYGSIFMGLSRQYYYEIHQGRIRSSLWQRPDLYIEGSPIFRADQVTTPLLIMHNKRDGAVPWSQAVEFFTALRRHGKKVWMLQYDQGAHGVDGRDAMDYTIRMTQFFDHYLKGQLAPRWMTVGIPASKKGLDLGYELDEQRTP